MENYESRFQLPNGRWAYIQLEELAQLAKREHIPRIWRLWKPPAYFYHHRRGGHVAALYVHKNNAWFRKVDLSSFFSQITRQRLTRHLKDLGYSFRDAEDFAIASTVLVRFEPRRFALPYGFVQSPLLASIALDRSELGRCLGSVHRRNIAVTAYVDDIIVSSNEEQIVRDALLRIRSAAEQSNFHINVQKSLGPLQSLQVFNVIVQLNKLEIAEYCFAEMRENIQQKGFGPASAGILSYVQLIDKSQADELLAESPQRS